MTLILSLSAARSFAGAGFFLVAVVVVSSWELSKGVSPSVFFVAVACWLGSSTSDVSSSFDSAGGSVSSVTITLELKEGQKMIVESYQ